MIEPLLFWLGVAVAGIVAICVGAELMLRARHWFEERFLYQSVDRRDFLAKPYHPYLAWIEDWSRPMFSYVPVGFRVFNTRSHVEPVRNNSLGFRCPEFAPPEANELRIAILGGSAAWGFGASSNDATIAGQLERILNEDGRLLRMKGKQVARCFNLAQVDGTQTQDQLTIVSFFAALRPEIVVSLTGWNELASNMRMREDMLQAWGFYLAEMEGWEPIKAGNNAYATMIEAGLQWGGRRSRLVALLAGRFARPGGFRRGIPEAVTVGTPLFLRNLANLVRLGKAYDYRHYQFLQPNLYRKRMLTAEETKVLELYDVHRPIHGGRTAGDFYRSTDIYAAIMAEVAAQPAPYGIVRNLESIFRDDERWMQYSLVHCTDMGYREIAGTVHDTILNDHLS